YRRHTGDGNANALECANEIVVCRTSPRLAPALEHVEILIGQSGVVARLTEAIANLAARHPGLAEAFDEFGLRHGMTKLLLHALARTSRILRDLAVQRTFEGDRSHDYG